MPGARLDYLHTSSLSSHHTSARAVSAPSFIGERTQVSDLKGASPHPGCEKQSLALSALPVGIKPRLLFSRSVNCSGF